MKLHHRLFLMILFLSIAVVTVSLITLLNADEQNSKTKHISGAKKALEFWTQLRAYPDNDIPKEKFYLAYKNEKLRLKKPAANLDVEPWEAMGPLNIPGRMISLALNPQNTNTLYAGAATGGLWRTYNSSTGEGWHRVTTGFPTLGVMAIAIDPNDTLKMLIGTGEVYSSGNSIGGYAVRLTRGSYGIGILKTTDGGVTWSKSLDWTFDQRRGIQDLALNPLNSSIVFAATSIGIYRSTDFGETWSEVYEADMAEDILIHSSNPDKILVSTGNIASPDAGIYRSLDGGDTWNKLSGIPYYTGKTLMDSYRSNPDIVFASVADSEAGKGLFKTTNFGDSWNLVHSENVADYQGFFSHFVAVHPTDLEQIVHAGVRIYKSSDGGTSLSLVTGPHVDHHNYIHDPYDDNVLYIANDGGVYRSDNFGTFYISIGYGLQTSQFYNGISSSYSDPTFVIGGFQDNGTANYTGSKNWRRLICCDGSFSAVNSLNDSLVYYCMSEGNIYKSVNRGLSQELAINGISGEPAFTAPYIISESSPSILYAGRTRVFKTINGAENWFAVSDELDGNPILSMAVYARDPDFVYAATAPVHSKAHLYRTTEGGNTWQDVTAGLPDRYLMDISIDPENSNTVYAVFGGYGSGHVYKTTNGGADWSDITHDLADVPALAVVIDPCNTDYVFVGNDLGVFASSDGGGSWNSYSDGLPEAVMAMDLHISPANRKLWLAAHGNGAYQRSLPYSPEYYMFPQILNLPVSVYKGKELQFSVTVKNKGLHDQTEDCTLEARMYDPEGQLVYTNTQNYCCLSRGESTVINFEGSVTLGQSDKYKFELISYANSQLPGNDTIRQSINVFEIEETTIANSTVDKIFKPYEAISEGETFSGDDAHMSVLLDFDFIYDGFVYDKVQMSTNGWLEFGTGTDGSERGLSTSEQLGGYSAFENEKLAGSGRPTKALGVWWDDLSADAGGKVSYQTLGNEPNRVFVCQWENIRGFWNQETTTAKLNFQVRLYEGSNKIEYCYGELIPGSIGGQDFGASIGFKDHVGGDFRFFDIAANGSGTVTQLILDLNPMSDWPGKDSAFVIQTITTDVKDDSPTLPRKIVLYQNYPNPFNPTTTIKYSIPSVGQMASFANDDNNGIRQSGDWRYNVTLKVYDILGKEVATLVNEHQRSGTYSISFDATGLSSGVYFYRLSAGKNINTNKMLLLR